jgi:hypothetical protein
MQEFNPRGAKRDVSFHQDRRASRALRNPQPQSSVSQFLAMVEHSDSHAKRREIAGGHGYSSLRDIHAGNRVI